MPKYINDMAQLLVARHNSLMGGRVDYNRPRIQNPDGSFSTEETITIPRGDMWYNVPTIINGQRVDPAIVENAFARGSPNVPHVGEFRTLDDAVNSARYRTDALATIRQLPQKQPLNALAQHPGALPVKKR